MGEQKHRYDARNGVSRTMIFDDASTTFTVHHQRRRGASSRLRATARPCRTPAENKLAARVGHVDGEASPRTSRASRLAPQATRSHGESTAVDCQVRVVAFAFCCFRVAPPVQRWDHGDLGIRPSSSFTRGPWAVEALLRSLIRRLGPAETPIETVIIGLEQAQKVRTLTRQLAR